MRMQNTALIGLVIGLASAPAMAATGNAAAGLQAMKEYNLIVLNDMTAGHDVEGKVLIGGNLSGNSSTFGLGNGSQGATASAAPTLTVAGNNSISNLNINNGSNGGSGTVANGASFWVGGNGASANLNGATPHDILVGGNLAGNYNVGSGVIMSVGGNLNGGINGNTGGFAAIGGTVSGPVNANGAIILQNQGIGFNNAATTISAVTTQVAADVQALSTSLAGLTLSSNPSSVGTVGGMLTLNAVDAGNGFALFNFTAAELAAATSIDYNFSSTSLPVIANVFGTSVTFGANPVGGATSAANQQIIWNFVDATSVDFSVLFHGSVLAPLATISNVTPLEGSIVAANFNQGGEVHLGTYDLDLPTTPGAVPEPASWAMMIGGLGLVGGAMRRRKSQATAVRFA